MSTGTCQLPSKLPVFTTVCMTGMSIIGYDEDEEGNGIVTSSLLENQTDEKHEECRQFLNTPLMHQSTVLLWRGIHDLRVQAQDPVSL